MGGAGGDVDFLQLFQGLCVEQVDGGALGEGHPNPPTWTYHVGNTEAWIRVGFKTLQHRDRKAHGQQVICLQVKSDIQSLQKIEGRVVDDKYLEHKWIKLSLVAISIK